MTRRITRDPIYRCRRFSAEAIELCVRWYITYRLSYRDLAAMMTEREIVVSHTTIMRWVLRYVPEYERRWARRVRHGVWTKRPLTSVAAGTTYAVRWIRRESPFAFLLCDDRKYDVCAGVFLFGHRPGRSPLA